LSAHVGANPEVLPNRSLSGLANFRIIPRIETYPVVLKFAQTFAGKFLILALFGVGLHLATEDWLPLTLCLAVITFWPAQRRLLVTLATLIFTFVVPWSKFPHPLYTSTLILFIIVIGALLFWSAVEWPRSFIGRHPIIVLLTGYSLLIVFAAYFPNTTRWYLTVWDFTATFGIYLWFIGYSLLDRRSPDRDAFALQLGTYRPFWGSTATPLPKGASYLRRIEAKDAQQVAVVQLKGLKLLVWSLLITVFAKYFGQFVHGYLLIPDFNTTFYQSTIRAPYPWYACWASLASSFLEDILTVCIWGHRFIACCRMAGFNALRNTYRPLSSRSIAEFWNRYYFYFKELLVEFFFYPTFMRFFKKHRNLRLITATFSAAFFGNIFYHFCRDLKYIAILGLWKAIAGFHVYVFYCFLLSTGICISQLRAARPKPPGFIRGRVVPALCVALFYMLINIFAYLGRDYPITEHFRYFIHLFQFTS
jgi:hypothetical protein